MSFFTKIKKSNSISWISSFVDGLRIQPFYKNKPRVQPCTVWYRVGSRGFTFIEMLVVFAIIGFLTAIIIYRYGKFNNQINLTNMAYEIAFTIREAQLSGITTANKLGLGQDTLDYKGYGVQVSSKDSEQTNPNKKIKLFLDDNDNAYCDAGCVCDGSGECALEYDMAGNIYVSKIVVDTNNIGNDCNTETEEMTILFKRPSPDPIIYAGDIEQAGTQITISDKDNNTMHVVVTEAGLVSVVDDENAPCRFR